MQNILISDQILKDTKDESKILLCIKKCAAGIIAALDGFSGTSDEASEYLMYRPWLLNQIPYSLNLITAEMIDEAKKYTEIDEHVNERLNTLKDKGNGWKYHHEHPTGKDVVIELEWKGKK